MTTPVLIKPTIGRRVWYWPAQHEGAHSHHSHLPPFHVHDPLQPHDAGIALVHGDRMVNLSVVDHAGNTHARMSVLLLQGDDEKPAYGMAYAQWMPYQVGQAKAAT